MAHPPRSKGRCARVVARGFPSARPIRCKSRVTPHHHTRRPGQASTPAVPGGKAAMSCDPCGDRTISDPSFHHPATHVRTSFRPTHHARGPSMLYFDDSRKLHGTAQNSASCDGAEPNLLIKGKEKTPIAQRLARGRMMDWNCMGHLDGRNQTYSLLPNLNRREGKKSSKKMCEYKNFPLETPKARLHP